MEKEEYFKIYGLEESHAWYVALALKTLFYIQALGVKNAHKPVILDAGCGTGGLLSHLKNKGFSVGIDVSDIALEICRQKKINRVIRSSVSCMPFRDNSFDIVTSLDVLYHKQVTDDSVALKECLRILKRKGILLLNLPAYQFLTSEHDRFEHGIRRYTRKGLIKKIKEAGFGIEKITYSNMFFFPMIALWRILALRHRKEKFDSHLHPLPKFLNMIILLILNLENKLQRHLSLPFGLSVFCIARKV